MSNIGHNNPPVDFAAIVAVNAPAAARDLSRGAIRLRNMATALLNMAMAEGASFNAIKVNTERAAGIEKGQKSVKPTVDGVTYTLTDTEAKAVKAQFATMFSHVAFFEGEMKAETVLADIRLYKADLLAGKVALSTAYKAVTAARRKAAAEDAKAEAEAEKAEAEAELTGGDVEMLAPETPVTIFNAATVMAFAEALSAATVPYDAETQAALEMLADIYEAKADEHRAALAEAEGRTGTNG